MSENESAGSRRDAARERARATRHQEQARRRRNRILSVSGVVVGVLAVATVVVLVVATSAPPDGPGPRNMASDGVVLRGEDGRVVAQRTDAVPEGGTPTPTEQDESIANITVYSDYMCPYCNQFETAQTAQIEQWVRDGTATLELHPIGRLDGASLGARYSTRSAAAAACVADHDPDRFLEFDTALYAEQPSEGTRGLSDDELVRSATDAGVHGDDVASCITSGQFMPWVADATNRVLTQPIPNSSLRKVTNTPTVIVNGRQYGADPHAQSITDPAQFAAFVAQSRG